jgi:hypothetical protein
MSQANVDLVRKIIEAYNRGDLDWYLAYLEAAASDV